MKKNSQMPQLKKEIQAAETLLSNLKTENQAVLQKRSHLRLEIEAETAKLLAKRQKELDKLELQAKNSLETIEDTAQGIKKTIGNLEFNRDSLNTEISGKITELNSLHNELGEVKIIIEAENSKITVLNSQQEGIRSSIDGLKEQIVPLQEQLSSLKRDIGDLAVNRANLLSVIETKTSELEVLKEESERDLSILLAQKTELTREIQDSQKQFKLERDDLASRKIASDERDDNLRRREYKVSRDEQMIQTNAGLLNL